MLQDLQDFMAKVKEDKALQEKMADIIKESAQEDVFANCNEVAAELGYTITEDDMQAYADEYKADLSDEELDKVAGGTFVSIVVSIVYSTYQASRALFDKH